VDGTVLIPFLIMIKRLRDRVEKKFGGYLNFAMAWDPDFARAWDPPCAGLASFSFGMSSICVFLCKGLFFF
jgi:hypothetical protein